MVDAESIPFGRIPPGELASRGSLLMHVRERPVRNARELVDSALGALFSGAAQLRDPRSRLCRSVASFWAEQRNAAPTNFRAFHETLGTFRLGQLWCQASERFVLLPGSTVIGIEPTIEF